MTSTLSNLERRIVVVHVIYRLDMGGMENGLVNLVNRLPSDIFSHVIVCLTYATDFRKRIEREDVRIVELHKAEGKDLKPYRELYRLLREVRPDIVHTRNIGTVDMTWVALAARCPIRVHSEHGWDASDPRGDSMKYKFLRRLCNPLIHRYIAVSADIRRWLLDVIGIAECKVTQIYNGVDVARFRAEEKQLPVTDGSKRIVCGTVGRHDAIKGLGVLLEAVEALLAARPEFRGAMRVVLAGDGPERRYHERLIREKGLGDVIEVPGRTDDVVGLLREFAFFLQPSFNEGISNTILEAMACGLPVIATNVGGNPELVRDGREGFLVPPGDAESLRRRIERYIDDPDLRARHGAAARERSRASFSLEAMTESYASIYASLVKQYHVMDAR